MNGIKYHRIMRGISQTALAEAACIDRATLRAMEHSGRRSGVTRVMPEFYLKLRDVLGISIDEMLREDLPDIKTERRGCIARSEHPENMIANYRRQNGFSFRGLAAVLGCSHEMVRLNCMQPVPPGKYITILAQREGLSEQDFIARYSTVKGKVD